MVKNYLKIAFRNLIKHKTISLINILGLAVGMACCILIMIWVIDELGFDKFHKKVDRIFRVVKLNESGAEQGIARVGAPWGPVLKQDYPEVENFVRFRYFGRTLISKGEKQFYISEGLYADSTIFKIFTFALVEGHANGALRQPNSVVITEELAKKYFGDEGALGKSLLFDNKEEYQITGVLKDVPKNSHFRFSFLIPFSMYDKWDLNIWDVNNFHLYLLLSNKHLSTGLEEKLPEFTKKYIGETEFE